MNRTHRVKICFLRPDGPRIDALRIVEVVSTTEDKEKTLQALTTAFSRWIEETPEGKKAWKDSSEDFNIGDAMDFFSTKGTPVKSLAPFLKDQGILRIFKLYDLTDTDRESYDRVLATPEGTP